MSTIDENEKNRVERPLGIWLVTIYSAVFMGASQSFVNLKYYYDSVQKNVFPVNPLHLSVNILLGALIVICAIGTWAGSSKLRYGLIALIVVQSGIRFYQQILLAGHFANNPQERQKILGRIIALIAITVIVVAYLWLNRAANRFLLSRRTW